MKAWRDLRHLPRDLWLLCLATLINRLGTMALPFLVLYLTRTFGWTIERAGSVMAVYGAGALLIAPVAGAVSDRWGALRLMKTSLASFGVLIALFPFARTFGAVVAMTVLVSMTNEAFRPASYALVGALAPAEHRKAAFALNRLAINLGMSVGPALGGFLAQRSFRLLFAVNGFSALSAAAILVVAPFRVSTSAPVWAGAAADHRGRAWLVAPILHDPAFRLFLVGFLPVAMVFWQDISTLPLVLVRDLHFTPAAYGALFTINTLLIVAIEIPLNSATAQWPHRRTLALGALLFALGYGAMSVAHTYAAVVVTVVLWTFGEMSLFPAAAAYVSEIAPDTRSGEYMGLFVMTFNLAFVLGPWLGMRTLARYGDVRLWAGAFVVGLISVALFSRVRDTPGVTPESSRITLPAAGVERA
jgi:MFS family permease